MHTWKQKSMWSRRIGKVRRYLRQGDVYGLIAEVCQNRRRRKGRLIEFLLPQIDKHIELDEFPFVTENRENPDWPESRLQAMIDELRPWDYHFSFSHGLTTQPGATYNQATIDFHRFRSKLISETIAELLGDALGQSTVLDLACHCGVFSLDMAFRGAKSVHGIELREKNIKQAEFLKDYCRIPNATFEQGDVYTLAPDLRADVVMCLGILYHVIRPVELIEFCYNSCERFAVIDTICHQDPISAYLLVQGKDPDSAIEGTRSVEFQPTYRAVIDTMRGVGLKRIVEVIGACSTPIELYSDHVRRCFIGFK